MKYQVIARKFRPQTFEDVVGQSPIVRTLQNAIEMDRAGHAYLFCGPRGVGKTTTARLLAKALNCAEGPTAKPCNECPSCHEITAGQSIDVLEIDAASNTGVDSIRELRENARYAPSRDRHKIFIIDEIHMLSTSAFNALLKILEEPPSHVAFIMATTERGKLPATILSRCQQFVFRTIPPAEIQKHLKSIAEREGIRLGEGALDYVVKAAEGSMRDAQSLLDQIIAFGGQEITDEEVREVLGFIPSDILDRSTEALIARDSKALIEIVEIVVDQGLNLQQFVREFLSRIRDLLLAKLGIAEKILGTPEERKKIASDSEEFSEQDLIRFFDMLLRLENDLRWTSEPRFHVEVGCIKLAKVGQLRDIEEVIRELKNGEEPRTEATPKTTRRARPAPEPRAPVRRAVEAPARKPEPAIPRPKIRSATESARPEAPTPKQVPKPAPAPPVRPPVEESPKPPRTAQPASKPAAATPVNLTLEERFRQKVEEKSPTTAVYLERVETVREEEDRIVIEVASKTVANALASTEHKQILEAAASELLGKAISVSHIMDKASGSATEVTSSTSLRESVKNEALVQSFLDVFRGDIKHIKGAEDSKKESGE